MKILCVIDSLGSGGAQRQLVELGKGFKEIGHEVSFLVYHPQDFYWEELRKAHIKITYIEELNYFKRLLKMRRFIRAGNFDAVLSFLEAANFISTFAGFPYRKWKLVVGERSANPNIFKSFKLRFYRWMHMFTDYVVANSTENIDIVKRISPFINKGKFKVIYNTIDFSKWIRVKREKINDEVFNLVVASRHQYLKNLKGLIYAVDKLSIQDKKKLVINWYGEERKDSSLKEGQKLIEKLNLQDNFIFFPATNDIIKKKIEADAIGIFSLYEGFPNTICEGMALGKPVISSDVSDISLFLNYNPKLICDPKSSESIKESLEYLLSLNSSQLNKIGEQNYTIAFKSFEKSKIVQSYLNLLAANNNE